MNTSATWQQHYRSRSRDLATSRRWLVTRGIIARSPDRSQRYKSARSNCSRERCRASRDAVTLEFTNEINSGRKIGSVLHVRAIYRTRFGRTARTGGSAVVQKEEKNTRRDDESPSFSRAFVVEHTSPCFMPCHTRKRDERSRGRGGGGDARRRAACVSDRAVALSVRGWKKRRKKKKENTTAREPEDRPACTQIDITAARVFTHAAPKWVRLPSRRPVRGRRLILFTRLFFAC